MLAHASPVPLPHRQQHAVEMAEMGAKHRSEAPPASPEGKPQVHCGLAREARWGADIIARLLAVATREAGDSPTKSVVPRTAIARACAVGFFEQHKYGAMVAVTKQRGFVIANLGWEGGKPRWSAPLFVETTTAGVGLSLGYEAQVSCVLLNTPEALAEFTAAQPVVGLDATLQAGAAPAVQEQEVAVGECAEGEVRVYSVARGRMVDVSLQGGAMAPSADNGAYYGRGTSTEEVLSGAVPPPREFGGVYDTLSTLAAEGQFVVQRLRDQGVKVWDYARAEPGWRSVY